MKATEDDNSSGGRRKRWLSNGFETLASRVASKQDQTALDFDVIIVGSGYGGAIAAHHLAGQARDGKPLAICVLERGQEYLAGMFPADLAELPGHCRISLPGSEPKGNLEGLFDMRAGKHVNTLLASGLGGGSLINAGVMLPPEERVFETGWPERITWQEISRYLDECRERLRAQPMTRPPRKYDALAALSPDDAGVAPITVASPPCNNCGNCATGCNFDAKISLDVSLLAKAKRANDQLECFTGATVMKIEPVQSNGICWRVHAVHTGEMLRRRFPDGQWLSARYLVIAAGSYGSTELLARSRSDSLTLSHRVGCGFSTNGDMLAAAYGRDETVQGISKGPCEQGRDAGIGPTITGYVDRRATDGVLIQELSVPCALRGLFGEISSTQHTLSSLDRVNPGTHVSGQDFDDPFSIDQEALDATSIYAMLGDDGAAGRLVLPEGTVREASIEVDWSGLGRHELFRRQMGVLRRLVNDAGLGGTVIANPLWQPLPESLDYLTGGQAGPVLTVHPLGGCRMAADGSQGVVDHLGCVFKGEGEEVYRNLVVLDGSIVPRALGVNPALTISALALRAVRNLSMIWGFRTRSPAGHSLPPRPEFREIHDPPERPARIRIHERLVGEIALVTRAGALESRTMEITLCFAPATVRQMIARRDRRLLLESGRVRIFPSGTYEKVMNVVSAGHDVEDVLEEKALAVLEVEGELGLFEREHTRFLQRTATALHAWLLNRGLRDGWQALCAAYREPRTRKLPSLKTFCKRLWSIVCLASFAGERRALVYRLEISAVKRMEDPVLANSRLLGRDVIGKKVVSYTRAANPLRQMMELRLLEFPHLHREGDNRLILDTRYLAKIGVPLIELCEQQDTFTALEALLGLAGYVARMLLSIHAWTFRLPDRSTDKPDSRLPGRLPGIPEFERFPLPHPQAGESSRAVITHYERSGGKPVLMLHGYSASGTTFAHESLEPSFAVYMWQKGWDVWVLDCRTSAGLDSSVEPWTFEQVADGDIAPAVEYIFRNTRQRVHVVAHCMGAAMFSMAVLAADDPDHPLRAAMREHIERVVLTQVGPGVVFSPANIFRAFVLSYLKHFLALKRFDFHVDGDYGLADQLLDRALNLLPYPREEFDIENPPWPPWAKTEFVATRHRMDMLYGRDFSLANVTPAFLDSIDAMFGPLNLDTVSQAMHFARWGNITARDGRNRYYFRDRLQRHWTFPTLSLHGYDNGLASVATLTRNKHMFNDAGLSYRTKVLPGFGHQDIWASTRSETEVFPVIHDFFSGPVRRRRRQGLRRLTAAPPFIGPMVAVHPGNGDLVIKLGKSPNISDPVSVVLVPVRKEGVRLVTAGFDLAGEGWQAALRDRVRTFDGREIDIDDNGMFELTVAGAGADAMLLTLLLYDEPPDLLYSTFGDAALALPARETRYQPSQTGERIRDAVLEVLRAAAAKLEMAVIVGGAPARSDARIAFASCQYPANLIDSPVALSSWSRLGEKLASQADSPPDLLLLLGDQVYVDATGGLFDPKRLDSRYVAPHLDLLSNDAVQSVLSKIPVQMMLDDHEISDNWEPDAVGGGDPAREEGEQAFRSFQFHVSVGRDPRKFWGVAAVRPVPVFMLNTRTERQPRTFQDEPAEMISARQFDALTAWLGNSSPNMPKIVTSSSMLLPRHVSAIEPGAGVTLDGWDGYPATFNRLLEFIARRRLRRVVFLSGDEHLGVTASAVLLDGDEEVARIHSIHTSPLYAPFSFANGRAEDFIMSETFEVGGTGIRCRVTARAQEPHDGFTLLHFRPEGDGWSIDGLYEGIGAAFRIAL